MLLIPIKFVITGLNKIIISGATIPIISTAGPATDRGVLTSVEFDLSFLFIDMNEKYLVKAIIDIPAPKAARLPAKMAVREMYVCG